MRIRRYAPRAVFVAVAAVWMLLPQPARAEDKPAGGDSAVSTTVTARVSGDSAEMVQKVTADLETAQTPPTFNTVISDTADARESFVNGTSDMVISGLGFSDDQLADLKKTGRGVIDVPLQATASAVFGYLPAPVGRAGFPTSQAWMTAYPKQCVLDDTCTQADLSAFTGPFRLTQTAIGQMIFSGLNVFKAPEFLDNLDPATVGDREVFPPGDVARPAVRSGADASNYYIQRYVQATQPDQWKAWLAHIPGQTADSQPSETWPDRSTTSRLTLDNLSSLVLEGVTGADSILNFSGAFVMLPPGKVSETMLINAARTPDVQIPVYRAQLRNGAGEWVSPTPEAITKAVASGNGAPLTGATTGVPGAYPLTWVNHLYAPESGLSATQANAIATMIRTQVTVGRMEAASLGDGQITPAMATAALAGADEVVESNCPSAGGKVITSTTGAPYAPAGVLSAVGSMKLCDPPAGEEQAVAGATGDETTPYDSSSSYDSSSYGDTGSYDDGYSPLGASVESAGGAADAGSVGGSGTARAAGDAAEVEAISRRMPMPLPTLALSPLDRVVTLGLGALTFVVLRNIAAKRSRLA